MPRVSVIAKNYAKALFLATKKANEIEKINDEIEKFRQNFSIDFACELKNSTISKTDSEKIIKNIGEKLKISKLLTDFLVVVSRNKRLNLFPEIYEEFTRLKRLQENILEVEIISAVALKTEDIENIKNTVAKKHSDKKIAVKQVIKQEILGGMQIKIGSNLIDASLKNQISSISKQLMKAVK